MSSWLSRVQQLGFNSHGSAEVSRISLEFWLSRNRCELATRGASCPKTTVQCLMEAQYERTHGWIPVRIIKVVGIQVRNILTGHPSGSPPVESLKAARLGWCSGGGGMLRSLYLLCAVEPGACTEIQHVRCGSVMHLA
ncbi:hypothetical protein XENORESO_008165 [Xenotaenia resolanae]|uniref:Uncharacterized protein n=1 Tax=Xenotaenia resolanae TaxID=208358 RepID=A0ABV0WME8_9TELE